MFQSENGEFFQTNCRPGFRSRFHQRINPWVLREFDVVGETMIHGFIEDAEIEVLFELQNITEVSEKNFQRNTLKAGLCGLAFEAHISKGKQTKYWKSNKQKENIWNISGEVISYKKLSNPLTGCDLYWCYLDLGGLGLEVLVNRKTLQGDKFEIGKL